MSPFSKVEMSPFVLVKKHLQHERCGAGGAPTVRQLLIGEGLWKAKRVRRLVLHQLRETWQGPYVVDINPRTKPYLLPDSVIFENAIRSRYPSPLRRTRH